MVTLSQTNDSILVRSMKMSLNGHHSYNFKNYSFDGSLLQQFISAHSLRNEIISLLVELGLDDDCYTEMLDYTIDLFENQGLGSDYYGYHNINHELQVTYTTLLASKHDKATNKITDEDLRHLYTAALFHDYDPQKSVDKPHEENVLKFISSDRNLRNYIDTAKLELEIVKALILRTTYPWMGQLKENAERLIQQCLQKSELTKNDKQKQEHIMKLGWFLSITDRVSTYVLGDFSNAMEMSKMNAHALAWHPSVIVRRSVAYFEELLNNETEMTNHVLQTLPKHMRKNFYDNVLSFMKLRQEEIQIQADYLFENLQLVPIIEKMNARQDPEFIKSLFSIYKELPSPLQFASEGFTEAVKDPNIILNTLRLGDATGEIIGFAKGGPLESYQIRPEIKDENYGLYNTIFLEPLAIKMGYWGMKGGSELRHLFTLQAHAKKFKYLTSFALRDVVQKRVDSRENAEFVTKFDPERWDYYRIEL